MEDVILVTFLGLAALVVFSFPIHLLIWLGLRIRNWRRGIESIPASPYLKVHLISTVIFIIVSLVLPNFLKFQDHPMYAEARINLGAIYVSQLSYFSNANTYAPGPNAFQLMNWEPAGNNRYAYYCDSAVIPNKLPLGIDYLPLPEKNWPVALKPASSSTGFTCMAIGNIDNDPDLDVWSINDAKMLINLQKD